MALGRSLNYRSITFALAVGLLFTTVVSANSFFDALKQSLSNGGQQGAAQQQGSVNPFNPFAPVKTPTRTLGGGTVTKGANIRSGPGTSNSKVGYLPAGTRIGIAGRSNNWYEIEAPLNGRTVQAWIYAPLVEVGGAAPTTSAVNGVTNTPPWCEASERNHLCRLFGTFPASKTDVGERRPKRA